MKQTSALILFISIILFNFKALAFVQNVTHGYPSCIACHVSPNGGGLLTDYGRSLSKELMSTWGVSDSFARPFFGVKNRETVKFGGDLRSAQTYFKNNTRDEGKFFLMQQNVELGVKVDNVMFVGTLGTQQGPEGTPQRGQFLSERHYALWSPTPTSRVRVGKFRQTFGINTPNHTRLIKSLLGFGALSETYNLEYTQFFETYEVTLGSSVGRIDRPRDPSREKNMSGHFTYYLNGNSRIGGSVLMGESTQERRFLTSVNAVLPLGEEWIIMSELDYEQSQFAATPGDDTDTIASFLRFGNTPFKGFMWYLLFEHASVDSDNAYSLTHRPGIGVQWLPIPHFNIQVEYLRQVNNSLYGNPNDIGYVIFHTYL